MKAITQDLTVGVAGLATSVATALLCWFIAKSTDFAVYTWSVLVIIPIGAILAGVLAASGYFLGAKAFGLRPTWRLLVTMIVISAGCFFLIHYLSYATIEVRTNSGRQAASALMPFGEYLDIVIRNTTIGRIGRDNPDAKPLGGWGYLFAVLQVIGFSLGGVGVFGFLASLPYCEACSKYLKKIQTRDRYTDDPESLQEAIAGLDGKEASEWQGAVERFGEPSQVKGRDWNLRTEHRVCPECALNWVLLETRVRKGTDWAATFRVAGTWEPGAQNA